MLSSVCGGYLGLPGRNYLLQLEPRLSREGSALGSVEKTSRIMSATTFASQAKDKPLYGPEGSSEGKVDPNTHKASWKTLSSTGTVSNG